MASAYDVPGYFPDAAPLTDAVAVDVVLGEDFDCRRIVYRLHVNSPFSLMWLVSGLS